MSDDLSPDRPWEREKPPSGGEKSPWEKAKIGFNPDEHQAKKFLESWPGRLLSVGAVVIVVAGLVLFANREKGPCETAEEAYGFATSLDTQEGRDIAMLTYATKSAECQSQGGTVRH